MKKYALLLCLMLGVALASISFVLLQKAEITGEIFLSGRNQPIRPMPGETIYILDGEGFAEWEEILSKWNTNHENQLRAEYDRTFETLPKNSEGKVSRQDIDAETEHRLDDIILQLSDLDLDHPFGVAPDPVKQRLAMISTVVTSDSEGNFSVINLVPKKKYWAICETEFGSWIVPFSSDTPKLILSSRNQIEK